MNRMVKSGQCFAAELPKYSIEGPKSQGKSGERQMLCRAFVGEELLRQYGTTAMSRGSRCAAPGQDGRILVADDAGAIFGRAPGAMESRRQAPA